MRQLVGVADPSESAPKNQCPSCLVSLAPPAVRSAATRLAVAEEQAGDDPMRCATALADWEADHGGYDAEVTGTSV